MKGISEKVERKKGQDTSAFSTHHPGKKAATNGNLITVKPLVNGHERIE